MADEVLRLQAEVQDKFTGPLKALRAQLLDASREGARHGETLAKGLSKAEAAAQATANTAKTVLNPALAGLGITGLTAGVAVTGIVSALNSLGSNLSSLGQLSRETGMAAEQLRVFQSVAGKFGISSDASASAAQVFSRNMRDIRRGVGDTMAFLQSQSPAVAEFAIKLRGTKNNDEANRLTEEFLEQIPDAVDRGRLAERIYGNADLGRLGDRHLGPIAKLNAGAEAKLGPLPAGAVESAERYERAIGNLRSSMQRIGTTIATELLVPAERFTSWIDDLASGRRKELTDGIRRGMHDIGEELGKIPWAEAGESAKQMLLATTALVQPLANSVKEVAAAIRSFNEGKPLEALRHLDGGHGPLARKLAPLPGDEKYVNEEAIGALRGKIGTAQEQGSLQADLLKELEERGDKDGAKRLREAMDANSRHLKELEAALQKLLDQGATAQKSSLEGDGPFGGARVQSAAFLGGGGFRRLPGLGGGANLPGGGSGPGYVGEAGPAGPGVSRRVGGGRFNSLGGDTPRLPGIGEGDTETPSAPGTYRPQRKLTDRDLDDETVRTIAGEARLGSPGGVDAVINNMFNRLGTKGWGPSKDLHDVARAPGQYEGYNPRVTAAQAEQIRSRIRAIASGSVPDNTRGSNSFRASWYRGPWWQRHGRFGRDVGGNTFAFDPSIPNGPYGSYPGRQATRMPSASGDDFLPNGAPRVLKPDSMKDAPGLTMGDAERLRSGQADGAGWAAREKARKDFEAQMRRDEGRLDASAARAGIVAGPKIENNGSVSVVVQKPGPDTQVRTSTTGNLFKDVVLRRGRPMAGAD